MTITSKRCGMSGTAIYGRYLGHYDMRDEDKNGRVECPGCRRRVMLRRHPGGSAFVMMIPCHNKEKRR